MQGSKKWWRVSHPLRHCCLVSQRALSHHLTMQCTNLSQILKHICKPQLTLLPLFWYSVRHYIPPFLLSPNMQLEVLIITGLDKLIIFIQKKYLCFLKWYFLLKMTLPELGEVTLDLFNFSVNPFSTKDLTLTNLRIFWKLQDSDIRVLHLLTLKTDAVQ